MQGKEFGMAFSCDAFEDDEGLLVGFLSEVKGVYICSSCHEFVGLSERVRSHLVCTVRDEDHDPQVT